MIRIFNQRMFRLAFLSALVLTSWLRYSPVLADVVTEEQELLRLVNQERTSRSIPGLNPNRLLSQVAKNYSKEMMEHGFLNHASEVDGSSPWDRVRRSGYYDSYHGNIVVRENIALISGPARAAGAHQAFMNSDGHRANLLASDINEIGVGITEGTFQSIPATIYVEVFAYRERGQEITLSATVSPRAAAVQRGETAVFGIHIDSSIPVSVIILIANMPSPLTWRLDKSSGTTPLDASLTVDTTSTPAGNYQFDIAVTGAGQTRVVTPILTVVPSAQSTTSQTQPTVTSSSRTTTPTSTTSRTTSAYTSGTTTTIQTQSILTSQTSITTTPTTISSTTSTTTGTNSTGVQTTKSSAKIAQTSTTETQTLNTSSRSEAQIRFTTWSLTSMRCIIATVAFGSELSPEIQFLRDFRDLTVMSTFSGRMFMMGFNTAYYAFSPHIASFIAPHPFARFIVRLVIYPLIATLRLTAVAFDAAALDTEMMILLCGLLASSLLGLAYGIPLAALSNLLRRMKPLKSYRRR